MDKGPLERLIVLRKTITGPSWEQFSAAVHSPSQQ
jgi:hypothetical protein